MQEYPEVHVKKKKMSSTQLREKVLGFVSQMSWGIPPKAWKRWGAIVNIFLLPVRDVIPEF